MEHPVISVIIPAFNAQETISRCLDSVRNQSVQNIEIICVNDGSFDRTGEIIRETSIGDSRIVAIDQSNQGVSAARNAGIEVAKGEYLGFVDADDTVDATYFEKFLVHKGISIIGTVPSEKLPIRIGKVYDSEGIKGAVFPLMLRFDVLNSCWYKLFKREIVANHRLRFPVGMKLGEDARFIMSFLVHAPDFICLNHSGYHYAENPDSATRAVKDGQFFDRMFEEFEFDHKGVFKLHQSDEAIHNLKSARLFDTFFATISLYMRSNSNLTANERKRILIFNMDRLVRTGILDLYKDEFLKGANRFKKLVYFAIRQQSYNKLFLLYKYSHWRNNIN